MIDMDEGSDRIKQLVGFHSQWIGGPRDECWRCSNHPFLDLIPAQGGAADHCGQPVRQRCLSP
ncbi:MAG TPA: hypothetical protein VJW23_09950, partial [Propionibacteriaceae bacterium]|nr:hypothetical protein [Propionibacteriaceae bacterium]